MVPKELYHQAQLRIHDLEQQLASQVDAIKAARSGEMSLLEACLPIVADASRIDSANEDDDDMVYLVLTHDEFETIQNAIIERSVEWVDDEPEIEFKCKPDRLLTD